VTLFKDGQKKSSLQAMEVNGFELIREVYDDVDVLCLRPTTKL